MEELSCANCPFDIEQPNGKPFCIQDATCEISVNWLNEHEQKIYNQALEDFFNKCLEENIQFYLNPIDCMIEVKEQLKK